MASLRCPLSNLARPIPGLFLLLFLWAGAAIQGAEARPNFLVVLCDDLGYGDIGCYGNEEVETPHLDVFAKEGVRFTQCYSAAANCSPSRAGLLTGRNPWRVGIHNWIPFLSPMHVPASEITMATLLKKAGYATCHSGKWHLNGWFNLPGQPQPNDHGFQHWFATQNNALPNHRNPYNFVRNEIPVGPLDGFAADLVAAEAVDWLRAKRPKEKPFFLFVCFHEPHEPIATDPKHAALYFKKKDPAERAYWGNITQMDEAFGTLMATLEAEGLTKDTLVFFTSDNGPAITRWHPYGSTGEFRAKKGHLYEGGIRVPGMVRWPRKFGAGQVVETPVTSLDLLPTFCALAETTPPADRVLDGTSLLPLLAKGEPLKRERPLFWHFHRAKSEIKTVLREGDWKICARVTGPQWTRGADITPEEIVAYKEAELTGFELYHLGRDPSEKENLADREPEVLLRMTKAIQSVYHEVRDESPSWPEWVWPRYEGKRIEWPEYEPLIKPPR